MDEDLTQEFMIIHKEIHNNKINYDINNNSENLKINFKNIINLLNQDSKNRIHDISLNRLDFVDNLIDLFYKEILDNIYLLLDDRDSKINKDNVEFLLKPLTNNIINNLDKFYKEKVIILLDAIKDKYNDFTFRRIDNYFNVYNYDRFLNKIKDCFNNNNLVLINTLKENIEIIEELNDNIKK